MITRALRSNLYQISSLLTKTDDFDLATDIITLLDLLSTSDKDHTFNVELMLKMTTAIIQYFFLCITQTGNLQFFDDLTSSSNRIQDAISFFRHYKKGTRSKDGMSLVEKFDMLLPMCAGFGAQRDTREQY